MKKPIAIISTDKHLKDENAVELISLAEQEIALAHDIGVDTIFWLGDLFDSRLSQRQELLNCFSEMICMYHDAGLTIHCIPGNHDKTDYTLDESFLSAFKYHPSFNLYEEPCRVSMFGIDFDFLPFYAQEVWIRKFNSLPKPTDNSVLLSHTAIEGSINNDGSLVSSGISGKMFAGYRKVFLGHYHNAQQPARNVFHIPSTRQNNFGENEDKGFTILYDDTSFELVRGNFRHYREIKVDCDKVTKAEIMSLAKTPTGESNVRVTLIGSEQAVKAVDKKIFTKNGISVKVKYDFTQGAAEATSEPVRELTGVDIMKKFEAFCQEKGYDYNVGYELLKEIMKWQ